MNARLRIVSELMALRDLSINWDLSLKRDDQQKIPSFAIIQDDDGFRQKTDVQICRAEQLLWQRDTPTIRNLLPFERYRHSKRYRSTLIRVIWGPTQSSTVSSSPNSMRRRRRGGGGGGGGGGEEEEEERKEERLLGPFQSSSRAAKTIVRRRQEAMSPKWAQPPTEMPTMGFVTLVIHTRVYIHERSIRTNENTKCGSEPTLCP